MKQETKEETFERVLKELQTTWELHEDRLFQERFKRNAGIRSSQVAALVKLLVDKGILK